MPQQAPAIPKYRLHKTSGRACVQIAGRVHWLGKHGTPESLEKYYRLVAEHLAHGGMPHPKDQHIDVTVNQLIKAFLDHAAIYYRKPDGSVTSEIENHRQALRSVQRLYGQSPAAEFGPRALRTIQQEMIRAGWCRSHINKQIHRVKHVYKWAAAQELIPPTVYQGLQTIEALRRGRSDARESEPVRPVPEEHIAATLPLVSPQVRALIELQLHTGARAGELVPLRAVDFDTSTLVWTFRPDQHKNAHHGHQRVVYFGPKAQAVLQPLMADRPIDGFLFDAAKGAKDRRTQRSRRRRTPISYGNRPGSNRTPRPQRQPYGHYTVDSYRRAISRACKRASVPHWHPHRLRHNAATRIRNDLGIEMARLILGHRSAAVTEIYAEMDTTRALEVMARIG
jgi:integrase